MLWYLMTVVPFRGQEGGAVVSFTDVTDRKRAVDEAQKRREELAHVVRVATVGELTASIAHEINQPLASIVTYANAGRRFLDSDSSSASDDVRRILRAIAEQGKRAGDIILHLRELLRRGPVERTRIDVNELLRGVLALVNGDALQRGVSMSHSLAQGLPRIPGDSIELQQVILNLVVNGFEAMSQGNDGLREMRFRTWSGGGKTVEIALSDTGPPIAEETFSKMFQRFYTSKRAGLGIGLSISQTIVEAHGGTLWAERNPERGLTMRVSLPAQDGC
jgi:C4-dicarboxylate-specific signal transduction histidine kinase